MRVVCGVCVCVLCCVVLCCIVLCCVACVLCFFFVCVCSGWVLIIPRKHFCVLWVEWCITYIYRQPKQKWAHSCRRRFQVCGKITYPLPNPNGCTVEVWEWISTFIPYFTVYDYLSMLLNGGPGPRFTNGFSIAIQIRWKFRFALTAILNAVIARQLCCRGMCKNLLRSNGQ